MLQLARRGRAKLAATNGEGKFIAGGHSLVMLGPPGTGKTTLIQMIAGMVNKMNYVLVGGPAVKKPEDLKGKKLGLTRLGSNSHYFVIQALRKSRNSAEIPTLLKRLAVQPPMAANIEAELKRMRDATPGWDWQLAHPGRRRSVRCSIWCSASSRTC